MTSMINDHDFIQVYTSADKEWPGYKVPDDPNASLPLSIFEIYRLIPYIGSEYVHFHPKNMPEVKIDKVEIFGIVTHKTAMIKYSSYTVDDSTGAIPVLYKKKAVSEDELTSSEESDDDEPALDVTVKRKLKPPYGLTPYAPYTYETHIRNLWRQARDEKPLSDEIALYDYVHVIGFCAMSFRNPKDVSELTDEDMELGRLFFYGLKIRRISEVEHNAMINHMFTHVIKQRYLKPKV